MECSSVVKMYCGQQQAIWKGKVYETNLCAL